jgi:hypothetical protein
MNDNDNHTTPTGKPPRRPPWNKGKLIGAKPPLRQGHVWSIRTRLQLGRRTRDRSYDQILVTAAGDQAAALG